MKLSQFLVIGFCSLFLLFVCLDRAQNTKGIQMHMNNEPVKRFGLRHWTKRCASSRFVQPKTKQLCTLLLKFFGFHNQFALLTMVFPIFRHTNQNNQSERFLVLQEEELERQRSHNVNKNT